MAAAATRDDGTTPIASVRHRQRVLVDGKVRRLRAAVVGVSTLECTLEDDTGALTVVFLARRHIPGIETRVRLSISGVVGEHNGNLAVLNPVYELRGGAGAGHHLSAIVPPARRPVGDIGAILTLYGLPLVSPGYRLAG